MVDGEQDGRPHGADRHGARCYCCCCGGRRVANEKQAHWHIGKAGFVLYVWVVAGSDRRYCSAPHVAAQAAAANLFQWVPRPHQPPQAPVAPEHQPSITRVSPPVAQPSQAQHSMSLLDRLNRDGFVVVPAAISPSQLSQLRAATHDVAALARAGHWPSVRTLPKQFPPWPRNTPDIAREHGIWGVQSMMHPDLPHSATFVAMYFSDAVVGPTKELLQCDDDSLVMELFNLLVRPDRDFELRWHRDDIPATATPDEELRRLRQPAYSAQWNLALYDDASLIVVPGSHTRARTEVERNADPFEKEIPGQLVVKLQAGDVVFYNNNILHRGAYDSKVERMTLHGSAGHVDGSTLRARNVLQHGVKDWLDRVDFSQLDERTKTRAEKMKASLVKMGQGAGDVGYSLDG